MREIRVMVRVGIKRVSVAFFNPDRLLGQLPGGFQVVRIKFFRDDVVVGIERLWLLPLLIKLLSVAFVENVSGSRPSDEHREQKAKLYFLLGGRAHACSRGLLILQQGLVPGRAAALGRFRQPFADSCGYIEKGVT